MPRPKKSFKCSRTGCGHVSKSQGEAVRHGWEHRRAEAKKAAKRAAAAPAEAVAVPAPRKPRVAVGTARVTYTPSVEEMGILLAHYQEKVQQVDVAITSIRQRLGGRVVAAPAASAPKTPTHRISAAGRARIAAAQRRRWAEAKHQTAAALTAT